MRIRRGEIERDQPIDVAIPEDAERDEQANNQLLGTLDDLDLTATGGGGAISEEAQPLDSLAGAVVLHTFFMIRH